jgi:23S rRNA pseudouridine1911/1915/1917 synthase
MSVTQRGKPAITRYAVQQVFTNPVTVSLVECKLETGRTHQIRVHMEHIGHPLVGDPVYRRGLPGREGETTTWRGFPRQALHASRLGLIHPSSGQSMEWFRPPPADLTALMNRLGFGPLDEPARVFKAVA